MIVPGTPKNIRLAASYLQKGKLIAFPTETVYGLGANALNQDAVAEIFRVKKRPAVNPLIVHISDLSQLQQVASIDQRSICQERIKRLSSLWPGPLSLVVPKHPTIPNSVTAHLNSVAVRIPAHPLALALLKEAKLPIAAPSANLSSRVSPTCPEHVQRQIGNKLEIILDGGQCQIGLESTVLGIHQAQAMILRPGAITKEQLEELLGEQVFFSQSDDRATTSQPTTAPASPGMLFKHYTPKTKIIFKNRTTDCRLPAKVGLISFLTALDPGEQGNYQQTICLGKTGALEEVAHDLYAAIHRLDLLGLDLIVIDACQETGIGIAIMDRLKRACGCF